MPKVARSKDYDVRAAVVRALLANGIARSDIRHEVTLDTYSSGGRADLAVLRDNRIIGIELKSGSDVLDRCEEQCRAMDRAFDSMMVIADIALAKQPPAYKPQHWIYYRHGDGLFTQHPPEHGFRETWATFYPGWLDGVGNYSQFRCRGTAPMWMASMLWANEVCPLTGSRTRYAALDTIRESFTLKEVRKHVIKELRARSLGRWEIAFWTRFDAAEMKVAA